MPKPAPKPASKYSDEMINAALASAATNPRYLIESSFSILDKDSRLVPLLFNPTQDHYWQRITPRDIIVKARKQGFTTIRVARQIAKCSTMEYRKGIVVSSEEDATKRILGRAIEMIKNCAIDLGAKLTQDTITFPKTKSSMYIGTAGQKAFGRGDDITDYHLTEFAWWQKPDLITGIEEACVNDSEGCIESTAKGYGTPFHKLWVRAVEGIAGLVLPDGAPRMYAPHFYAWWQDPTLEVDCQKTLIDLDDYELMLKKEFGVTDRKILWRRLKREAMFDPNLFPQEYPATPEEAFLVAGDMVFDPIALRKHEESARKPLWVGEVRDMGDKVGFEPAERGRLTVWLTPQHDHQYGIAADVAAGVTDGDFSVADVIDLASGEQVAQWHGHLAPELFGDLLCYLGDYYNFAILWPEVNNHGLTTCNRIRDNEYPNLLIRETNVGGTNLGFYTSSGKNGTRIEVINSGRSAIRDYHMKINSRTTIGECRTFITLPNGDMDAQGGARKDCVMSMGIAAIMFKTLAYIPEARKESFKRRIGTRIGNRISAPQFKRGYR